MSTDLVVTQAVPVPTRKVGTADIVGFGQDGVYILRNSIQPSAAKVLSDFGYNAGNWRIDKHVRIVGPTVTRGLSDIIGFGDAGVLVARNLGNNTYANATLAVPDFGYNAGGWRIEKHLRYVSDLRKTGLVDVVGFGDAGVLTASNQGNGTFGPTRLAINNFGYNAGGWRVERHLRFLADTTGDGFPDIVGFGESNVFVSINKGDGTFQAPKAVINNFTYSAGGWRIEKHPRTLADLTGNGKADIVGFGNAGVYVSLNNGDGTFQAPKLAVANFGYVAGGWRVEQHPRFVADVTRNGRGDVVGFGNAGVWVSINNGDGTFQAPKLVLDNFGYNAGGWRVEKHLRFPVDLTGDGAADIIGFGEGAVWVSFNDGNGNFGPVQKLTDAFSFNGGQWGLDKTVRWAANLFN